MKRHFFWLRVILKWLPLAFVITFVCVLVYFVDQQHWRLGANYPQIAMADRIAAVVGSGQPVTGLLGPTVDLTSDQSTWVMIFDAQQKLNVANVTLNGIDPALPAGVLNDAVKSGESRITWQPMTGVRQAIVVKYFHDTNDNPGWVVVGRSLTEIETRTDKLGLEVLLAYGAGLLGSFAVVAFTSWSRRQLKKHS
jgi:hypothetical protein